jgi:predicted porin
MDWMPADRLNVQFNGEYSKDKYSGHTYGLREGTAWLFSTDASYAINEDWELTAWYSHDNTEATQHGWREGSNGLTGNAELDKLDDFNDTGDSIGLGMKARLIPKLKIGADLQWTRNTSEINQALTALSISPTTGLPVATTGTLIYATGTAAAQLPDITSTVTRIKLFAVYALQKNSDLRVDLIHERWKTNDWSWQFSDGTPFTYGSTTSDGTTVYMDPKQNSTFVGVRYAYKFQ